ncbi:biotin synthase [Puccinia graminis f. sp. tritici]|uniref:biotin synthase n=1 Tax=Puccinia graminis f. sp. tritici TaxID=56615 RepID=A0A5B0Q102_PUCGR|nr:biotin synthase [Puccinia graminis f. sp. tritici]
MAVIEEMFVFVVVVVESVFTVMWVYRITPTVIGVYNITPAEILRTPNRVQAYDKVRWRITRPDTLNHIPLILIIPSRRLLDTHHTSSSIRISPVEVVRKWSTVRKKKEAVEMWKQLASSRSILRSEPGRSPMLALKLAGGARRSHATAPPSALDSLGSSSHLSRRWTKEQVKDVYESPLMELVFRAATTHRAYHDPSKVQLCTLLNIKTGGCTEDCSYCAQSSRYSTGLQASKLIDIEPVLAEARKAKANGSTRFCMGAAWRDMNGRKNGFKKILEMVKEVRAMGMEVCTTLGMLSPEQAVQLKEAGLTAYNHNLDTSREYYPKVISTRSYDERLQTIENVREAGLSVCSGGIIGLGESDEDRIALICQMSQLPAPPESFPVNALVPIPGTPLGDNERVSFHEILRTISTARIVLPTSIVRFAAGRNTFSEAEQAMCFMAGANAIFTGEKMLTTPTSGWDEDISMFSRWGITPLGSFASENQDQAQSDSTADQLVDDRRSHSTSELPTVQITA